MSNSPLTPRPPPPSGELFQVVLQQVAHLTAISRSGGAPAYRATLPNLVNNLSTSQRLAYNMVGNLYTLNPVESARFRSINITEENRLQVTSELLMVYICEVEALCDQIYAGMDQIVQRFNTNQQQYQASQEPMNPGAIITHETALNWRQTLLDKVVLLRTTRLVLVDLAERFPIEAMYRAENVLVPLHNHLAATFVNTKTVANDAKLLMQALTWYANMMRFYLENNSDRSFA